MLIQSFPCCRELQAKDIETNVAFNIPTICTELFMMPCSLCAFVDGVSVCVRVNAFETI